MITKTTENFLIHRKHYIIFKDKFVSKLSSKNQVCFLENNFHSKSFKLYLASSHHHRSNSIPHKTLLYIGSNVYDVLRKCENTSHSEIKFYCKRNLFSLQILFIYAICQWFIILYSVWQFQKSHVFAIKHQIEKLLLNVFKNRKEKDFFS